MRKPSRKGSNFEREISKRLGLWWSNGERDDIFWRTSASGARAKIRSYSSQKTFGQYGDIQAIDPIGQPLLDLMTIEIKRGYSGFSVSDLIDKSDTMKIQPYEDFLIQAITDHKNAGTPFWALITKRDKRTSLIFLPSKLVQMLNIKINQYMKIRHLLPFYEINKKRERIYTKPEIISFFIFHLEDFLQIVSADNIIEIFRKMKCRKKKQ
jgi:hypothetical protein